MEYTCIVCPNGCRLTVESTVDGVIVKGNKCPKGETYGKDEFTDPQRVVTAVVRTTSPRWPVVPVKSDRSVPRNSINDILSAIYRKQVNLPVKRGDICIDNCCSTGAAIVFTRTVPTPAAGTV